MPKIRGNCSWLVLFILYFLFGSFSVVNNPREGFPEECDTKCHSWVGWITNGCFATKATECFYNDCEVSSGSNCYYTLVEEGEQGDGRTCVEFDYRVPPYCYCLWEYSACVTYVPESRVTVKQWKCQ